jgi:hypothetical protein
MILTVHEIQPSDVRHLFCSDKRLEEEVARLRRPVHRPVESASPTHGGGRANEMTAQPPRSAA